MAQRGRPKKQLTDPPLKDSQSTAYEGGDRENHIVTFVNDMVRWSEDETLPDREAWEESFMLFKGQQNWGADRKKNTWMTQAFIHEFSVLIRRAAVSAQNVIFERGDFLHFPLTEQNEEFQRIQQKILKYHVKQANFMKLLYEYLLSGGITGLAIWKLTVERKPTYKPEVVIEEIKRFEKQQEDQSSVKPNAPIEFDFTSPEQTERQLTQALQELFGGENTIASFPTIDSRIDHELVFRLSIVNPLQFGFHPDVSDINESPFMWERIDRRFFELADLFKSGVLDKNKEEELLKTSGRGLINPSTQRYTSTFEQRKMLHRNQLSSQSAYAPVVSLVEYWGPLMDKKGRVLEENMHFVVGNGQVLLKDEKNRYFSRKPPYIIAVLNKDPFKPTGQGIADGAKAQQVLINDLTSLYIDLLRREVHAPVGVLHDKFVDDSQLEGGVRPGQTYMLQDIDRAGDAIEPIRMNSQVGPEVLQIIEMLRLTGERSASVDSQTANPSSRARISASEVQLNAARTSESVRVLSHTLDVECLEPLARRFIDLTLQYGLDISSLDELFIKGILSSEEHRLITNISLIERFNETKRHVNFEVRGFRYTLQRDDDLARKNEFVRTISLLPPGSADIQWENVVKEMARGYGFNTDEWFVQNNPRDKAREENRLLANNQMVFIGEQDEHALELPIHYEQVLKTPNQAIVSHIRQHVEVLINTGQPVPPPPPEAATFLGLEQAPSSTGNVNQAGPPLAPNTNPDLLQ